MMDIILLINYQYSTTLLNYIKEKTQNQKTRGTIMDLIISDVRNNGYGSATHTQNQSVPHVCTLLAPETKHLPAEIKAAIEPYILNKGKKSCQIKLDLEINQWIDRKSAKETLVTISEALTQFILDHGVMQINLNTSLYTANTTLLSK
jgi:hypothetical protein